MFAYSGAHGALEVAFTDRWGGVSREPFASLNLASGGDDDPEDVRRNLERALEAFTGTVDASLALMRQVHGAEVAMVGGVGVAPSAPGAALAEPPVADGLVTCEPGVTLVVRVADCVPVLLGDAERGVAAALHAGRQGLVEGVVPAGVAALERLGARRLVAWVGPHVCGRCYEVPVELREAVASVVPEARAETSWGTPSLDVGAGVLAQLRAAGAEVVSAARCTLESPDLYSYRRDGARAGRFAGLVRVRP
jgi:YfiH family protein